MNAIWKYPLDQRPTQDIEMPYGASVVRVAWQDSEFGHGPMLWALVDDEMSRQKRRFRIVTTGEPFVAAYYVGSFEVPEVGLVMHVVEEP